MKKIFENKIFLFFCISSLFLTGCKKKKIENKDQIIVENNEIETYENKDNLINKESIFADNDESEEENIIYEKSENENISKDYNSFEENNEKQRKIGTLYFNFNIRNKVRDDQISNLNSLKEEIKNILSKNKNSKLLIIGHACNSEGTEEYNMQLSDDRATTIKKILLKEIKDIKKENISSCGRGISELLISGNKKEQAINRRVEIFVLN